MYNEDMTALVKAMIVGVSHCSTTAKDEDITVITHSRKGNKQATAYSGSVGSYITNTEAKFLRPD